uniref:Nebulette n=1 Tax=Pipistrellus kuhlii TaxID=59472 RepID=A0A7J8B2X9_PIPKU|nr:nebulette [Pipistrellus kuhlii]
MDRKRARVGAPPSLRAPPLPARHRPPGRPCCGARTRAPRPGSRGRGACGAPGAGPSPPRRPLPLRCPTCSFPAAGLGARRWVWPAWRRRGGEPCGGAARAGVSHRYLGRQRRRASGSQPEPEPEPEPERRARRPQAPGPPPPARPPRPRRSPRAQPARPEPGAPQTPAPTALPRPRGGAGRAGDATAAPRSPQPPPPPPGTATMNPQCARCGKVVYPTEKVNCLDKYWHKGCFHCEVCKMALNMNNYKGYEKRPYCNAHYPKQSFTTVADTPENLRLKQQSELQSQVKYKRDFEESKGRGFSIVTDTPELQRLKRTQEQISNVKYHEDFEKTKGRGFTPVVDDPVTERVRKNTQVVSDAAYKGVHPHVVEMDRRPGIIVAPVLPGAYQQSHSQGYGYMHQTSLSSMRSMQHSPNLRTYRAMYDYSAQDEDEVSFRDGDYIVNVQPIDDGWMYGTVQRTGKTGMLPANYIEFVN